MTVGNHFPEVLLFGNGLIHDSNELKWEDLIKNISINRKIPEKMESPYPIQIILATEDNVDKTLKEHKPEFYGKLKSDRVRRLLESILSIGFDDILTTNYSYELEAASLGKETVSDYLLTKSTETFCSKAEGKYMLSTYHKVSYKGTDNRVWHIHGEARKPSGMIIGHYYYGIYLSHMMKYLEKRHGFYSHDHYGSDIRGWLDSFIKGNVYILGQGLDFSEFDLWWLINRKKRENGCHGKIYYYTCDLDPENNRHMEKKELLRLLDVEVIDMRDMFKERLDVDSNQGYLDFYEHALEVIKEQIKNNRTAGDRQG